MDNTCNINTGHGIATVSLNKFLVSGDAKCAEHGKILLSCDACADLMRQLDGVIAISCDKKKRYLLEMPDCASEVDLLTVMLETGFGDPLIPGLRARTTVKNMCKPTSRTKLLTTTPAETSAMHTSKNVNQTTTDLRTTPSVPTTARSRRPTTHTNKHPKHERTTTDLRTTPSVPTTARPSTDTNKHPKHERNTKDLRTSSTVLTTARSRRPSTHTNKHTKHERTTKDPRTTPSVPTTARSRRPSTDTNKHPKYQQTTTDPRTASIISTKAHSRSPSIHKNKQTKHHQTTKDPRTSSTVPTKARSQHPSTHTNKPSIDSQAQIGVQKIDSSSSTPPFFSVGDSQQHAHNPRLPTSVFVIAGILLSVVLALGVSAALIRVYCFRRRGWVELQHSTDVHTVDSYSHSDDTGD